MKRCVSVTPDGNVKHPAYERANLVDDLRNEIQKHQDSLRNNLAELFFFENGGNLIDLSSWCSQSNPYLENYIQQIKCASTDAVGTMLEQVPTGHTMPKGDVKKKEPECTATPFMSSMAAIEKGENGVLERAKYESLIVQQVALLKEQGMWSLKRLPKVKEPSKIKCHWDYLLEEMQWLSTDFYQERKWKKAAAKKLAYAVAKVFEDKAATERKKHHDQEKKLKKKANNIAKEVMKMWSTVEKVHKFKQDSQLEERRKKLMDSHLNFIVGQTEQYSSWLAEGLCKSATERSSVMMTPSSQDGDVEFKPPNNESGDDEETIAAAEQEDEQDWDEISDLQKQGEMDIDELVNSLPPGMLDELSRESESRSDWRDSDTSHRLDSDTSHRRDSDASHRSDMSHLSKESDMSYDGEDDSVDNEDTIAQDEQSQEGNREEISGLEADKNVPLDELIARYVNSKETFVSPSSVLTEDDLTEDSDDEADCEMTVSYVTSAEEMDKELGALCKEAAGVKPTSYAQPLSKIPFLMRGLLRGYQHVGLDWLVAMEQKRLNGILADEMGLGKTIQTIALLAHLACFRGIWGPHLIIVPTSVLLNWDLEFKKWCPGFKVMSYYGSQKERKEKRVGWTKPNSFHVCVTSYKLVVQDYRMFRCKKWYYMILDEAHNIKNFKSQRWQLLLNFNAQRRLLLTGTPLQNNLMELWSLMHFLMPTVFGSQKAFKEWFSNPLTGMIEGTEEYNSQLIQRLHKILRPFLLRRLKKEVERELPQKTESVLMCGLSRRQRALYEEFLSRRETSDTLSSGQFLSVIGVLMQLRKVCNHPDLFEPRPVISPYSLPPLQYYTPQLVLNALRAGPLDSVNLDHFNLHLADYELDLSAYAAHRSQQLRTHRLLIEELDYKGVVPDNLVYSAASHSTFAPPRPPSPTLPPLPFLRQMPSLNAAPRSHNTPRTSPHPINSSPSDSSGLTPPPLSAKQITNSRESTSTSSPISSGTISQLIPAGYFRDPVSGIVLPLVDPGMPPPRRPPLGPPQLTKAAGPRLPRIQNKRGVATPRPPILTPGSCSSPEPLTLRPLPPTMSPAREIIEHSPNRSWSVESPSRDSTSEREMEVVRSPADDPLHLPSLEEIRRVWREGRRKMTASVNELRCQRVPMYGKDLVNSVTLNSRDIEHKTVEERLDDLQPILNRYLLYCPAVLTQHTTHTKPTFQEVSLQQHLSDLTELYHPIKSKLAINIPETRLIQYDCGKLQRLDVLLRALKQDKHRILIFTQMTKMLDILEKYLNYHAYTYMRLDGTTKVDKRLELMERFNADNKIFCMILSTRSGGVGVNLTGADTVIFYDSDWNPTMDAQAQDRCHRIGQTRDVHIYRLVSERTIEENILKKANQKRLLGSVAIEDGNFTMAFFKKDNLSDLFGSDVIGNTTTISPKHRTIARVDLEQALAEAEDVDDVEAAKRAKGELIEEMNDFDEEIPIEGEPQMGNKEMEMVREEKEFSKFEEEITSIENELTPVEKYALRFIESENVESFRELLRQQDEELAAAAPEATLADLQAAKQDEEKLNIAEVNDVLLTYASWDPQDDGDNIWLPPTPPPQEHDVYQLDPVMQSMYCLETTMTDAELPEVTIIPNLAFQIIPPLIEVKQEPEDPPPPPTHSVAIPPPLPLLKLEPVQAAVVEETQIKRSSTPEIKLPATPFMRKEVNRKHKKRQIKIKQVHDVVESDEHCTWLPSEDYALHQSLLSIQEMTNTPNIDYNWNVVSSILNVSSNNFKTSKQCRERHTLLLQRDELQTDQRKTHRPSRLSAEEAGQASTLNFMKLFYEIEKLCTAKANFDYKPLTANSISSNPTHTLLSGTEQSPVALASKKKDRENKENKDKQSMLQRRENERNAEKQSHGLQHKTQEVHVPRGSIAVNNIQSTPYQMPRKLPEQSRGATYSVMTPAGVKGHSQQFYLLSAQRPMQGQVGMQGGKPLMSQGKPILVSAGQQPVKMQSQHMGYMPQGVRGNAGYIPNNEELIQQMKRQQPHYRTQHPNNLIPLNMAVHKQYIPNGPYIPPMRGGAPKGVRSMGPLHIQRTMPIQSPHVVDGADGIHHNSRILPQQVISGMPPPSPSHHQMPPSPQVMQQLKPAPASRTI